MDLGLRNTLAVVTGASRGIGRAIAVALAAEGVHVILAARGAADLEAASNSIRSLGGNADCFNFDAASSSDAQALIEYVHSRHASLNILINNAGGMTGAESGLFTELTDEDWRSTYELNVMGAVRLVRGFRALMAGRSARIINIASENGIAPERVYPHYNAAKAALIALTKSLSLELAREQITVNCVSPGIIATEGVLGKWNAGALAKNTTLEEIQSAFMRARRKRVARGTPGTPAEVAAFVAFLCSPHAAFMTGTNYRIDGGQINIC